MVAKAVHILLPSALQKIEEDLFRDKELEVYIKRDDLIHPLISGNKWRKLSCKQRRQIKYACDQLVGPYERAGFRAYKQMI